MLNKHNLSIAALAPTGESRFTLGAILVRPDCTVETDGHQLVHVTTPRCDASAYPDKAGTAATILFKPFLLSTKDALEIAKAIPKKVANPILQNVAVDESTDVNGHSKILAYCDPSSPRVFEQSKTPGNFPDYERVMPKGDPKFSVAFNGNLLGKVLKQASAFADNGRGMASVALEFFGDHGTCRITARGGDEQVMTALVMPINDADVTGDQAEREKAAKAELATLRERIAELEAAQQAA